MQEAEKREGDEIERKDTRPGKGVTEVERADRR